MGKTVESIQMEVFKLPTADTSSDSKIIFGRDAVKLVISERNSAIQDVIKLLSQKVAFGYLETDWVKTLEQLESLKVPTGK